MKLILFLLQFLFIGAIADATENLETVAKNYVTEYRALNIPAVETDYHEYFKKIPDITALQEQKAMFDRYEQILKTVSYDNTVAEEKYLFAHLQYEFSINQQRLLLELKYKTDYPDFVIPQDGLFGLPDHEQWYAFFLRYVNSKIISSEEVEKIGEAGVKQTTKSIAIIQKAAGYNTAADFQNYLNSESFFITDEAEILKQFTQVRDTAYAGLKNVFEDAAVSSVNIVSDPAADKNTPPGYYDSSNDTFYFNNFENHYNSRSLDWLFIHEAAPGHHYQVQIAKKLAAHPLRDTFFYHGFSEGWGAYSENLGAKVGLYKDMYRQLGMYEWNLVRFARLVMDVGIHLHGWTNQQALDYWKLNVPNQDAIAMREIERIRKWPAQVTSYKVGENEILALRKKMVDAPGDFDIKKFHTLILGHGSIPLEALAVLVEP